MCRFVEAKYDSECMERVSSLSLVWQPNYTKEKEERLLQQISKTDRDFLQSRTNPIPYPKQQCTQTVVRKRRRITVAEEPTVEGETENGREPCNTDKNMEEAMVATKRRRLNDEKENREPCNTGEAKGRRRKGPDLYKGLLTCPEGVTWVTEFEKNHKEYTVTTSTVTLNSAVGPIVVTDGNVEAEKEVADPKDYFTALEKDAIEFFNVDNPCFL